ncbi:MAG: hypothetical protein M3P39_10695, partial [Actinomycetota bacterium]|nr:hypothetical protein [Actinomycetota bacterium]
MRTARRLPVALVVLALGVLAPAAGAGASGEHADPVAPQADAPLLEATRRAAGLQTTDGVQVAGGPWCGDLRVRDDVQHASHTGARVKVIYAHPADRPSRFGTLADLIQGDAKAISDLVAAAGGGARTVRFDTGTRCGPGYLDVLHVQLPGTAAEYTALGADPRATRLTNELAPVVATMAGSRNYAVYADHLYANDGVAGIADFPSDDRPAATNVGAKRGGYWAFAFGRADRADFLAGRTRTIAHEIGHTLGAVQTSSPNTTGAGHCVDERDIMCYADGGPRNAMLAVCGAMEWDCGRNDYFNAAPAPGSYLATRWNTFDSPFMCAECAGAPSSSVAPTPTSPPPAQPS